MPTPNLTSQGHHSRVIGSYTFLDAFMVLLPLLFTIPTGGTRIFVRQ